jgi:ClpP class serine protease
MRGSYLKAELLNQAYMVCPTKMKTYMDILGEEVAKVEDSKVANNNVTYSNHGSVAVISIDGAMYKKGFNGACGETVVAYPDIIEAIDIAEQDGNVNTILFRVDTPGGSVAGADEVRYRIKNSPKKTITFYENLGASGGMWIFTAADEIYASPITWLGSIGVVVAYEKDDGENKTVELVSKNAPNKRCSINGDCEEKMQNMINSIEDDFFATLEDNTGFNKESIIKIFDNGGVIKAEVAKENGFIKDISQFSVLLENLKQTAGEFRMEKEKKEATMIGGLAFNEENFTTLIESREKSQASIKSLNEKIKKLEASENKIDAEAVVAEKLDALKANIKTRVMLAMSYNIKDANIITDIITADSEAQAVEKAIDSKQSVAVQSNDGGESTAVNTEKEKKLAEIMAKKYSI